MMRTCEGQEMTWWSDRCATEGCGHLLAAHRDVVEEQEPILPEPVLGEDGLPVDVQPDPIPVDPVVTAHGECTFCVMEIEQREALEEAKAFLLNAVAEQNTALRGYSDGLNEQVKEFATGLRNSLKDYVDNENGKFAKVAKDYVDGQVTTTVKNYVDAEVGKVRADSKSYIDTKVGEVPTWTNNRIAQTVKPTALNFDPRTTP